MDDDVNIEDVPDDEADMFEGARIHPMHLRNKNPDFLMNAYVDITEFIGRFGWIILIGAILLIYLWRKYSHRLGNWKSANNEDQDLHRMDTSKIQARHEAMDAARRRMQEQYDIATAKFKEEEALKAELKRVEKIADWERHQQGLGYRSKVKSKEEPEVKEFAKRNKPDKKNIYRSDDYNPLTGEGGGGTGGYRPSRKGGAGGG